jgi:S-adenosylmethionine:tRNA ribosyltransferase-isomerase
MTLDDLNFSYPEQLVAVEPSRPTRVALMRDDSSAPQEASIAQLLKMVAPGDAFVVNESKVIPARVFSKDQIEVLFLSSDDGLKWQVLFPARDFYEGDVLNMPGGLRLTLLKKGLPQVVQASQAVTGDYFDQFGEVALPPYIQQARGERHNRALDKTWYQPAWAAHAGSVAAPTASLHFQAADLQYLRERNVNVLAVTLHVGAGTFLPVRVKDLKEHQMHEEWARVPASVVQTLQQVRQSGGKVWALGTTVTRTLESMAQGLLQVQDDGSMMGPTKLFIHPPYEFKIVDRLLTNFHQPQSTLLALVAAYAGLERTQSVYRWAIDQKFRLFSYGDLSAWMKP